jgi:uncharacterized RDD family membrane protein YckC
VIDWFIIIIPAYILMAILSFGAFSAAGPEVTCDANGFCTTSGGSGFFVTLLLTSLIPVVLAFAYKTYFDGGEKGQSVGKMAMKIQIRDEATGGPLGYGKAAMRTGVVVVLWLVCFIPLLVSLLFPLWDPKRQTLHDKAANSIVVDVP